MGFLMSPVWGRKSLAVVSMAAALAAAYFGRCFSVGMPFWGTVLIFASGAFTWTGRKVWCSRSLREARAGEAEDLRRVGLEIVSEARMASLVMFAATAVSFQFGATTPSLLAMVPAVLALLLALHAY